MMAGPWDSVAAGLGSTDARARLAAERDARAAARAAEAEAAANASAPIPGMIPMSAVGSIPDELTPDSATGVSWQPPAPDVDLAAMARADMAAEQQAQQQPRAGVGMLTGAQAVQGGQAAMGRALDYGQRLMQTTTRSRPNVDYGPTRDYLRTMGDVMGDESAAARAIVDAEREAAETEAAYYIDEHARASAEAQAQADVEQVRQDRAEAQVRAMQAAEVEIAKAADAFASAPDVDPMRYWTDRTAGQRAAGVLAAAAFGLAGWSPEQATAHLRAAQDADIDAQKFNSGLRERKIGARLEQYGAAERTFERLREHFGDARQAEAALRAARWDEAKARLNALRASAGLSLQDASHQQMLAAFDKQAAQERFALARMQARNVPRFVTRSPVLTGGARDVVRKLFEHELQQSGKLQEQGLGIVADAAADDAKLAAETAKDQRVAREKQATTSAENKRFIARETGKAVRVRQLAQDLLDDIDRRGGDVPGVAGVYIPGIGAPSHELTADARDFKRRLEALKEYDITDLTGAVAGDDQKATIQRFLEGDEDAIVSGLREIQRAMDAFVAVNESVDPAAAEEMRRAKTGANAESVLGGFRGARVDAPRGASSVVRED